jgi:hypothetical protein
MEKQGFSLCVPKPELGNEVKNSSRATKILAD